MENLKLYNINNEIYEILNQSQLSIGEIYFILKPIFLEAESLFFNSVKNEYQQAQQKEKDNNISIINQESKAVPFSVPVDPNSPVTNFNLDAKTLFESMNDSKEKESGQE